MDLVLSHLLCRKAIDVQRNLDLDLTVRPEYEYERGCKISAGRIP